MIRHYGRIIGIETYKTTDGKEFYDFDDAQKHQDELDSKEAIKPIIDEIKRQIKETLHEVL